jgi:hypothetical protein
MGPFTRPKFQDHESPEMLFTAPTREPNTQGESLCQKQGILCLRPRRGHDNDLAFSMARCTNSRSDSVGTLHEGVVRVCI